MIKAVIFDMDGLLIDSEPLWQEAEIAVFGSVGIELTVGMCLETMGLRIDQVVGHWENGFPGKIKDRAEIGNSIVEKVIELVWKKGESREGVQQILDFIKNKPVRIALASSSQLRLINAVVDKLDIRGYFEKLYSAEFEEYGKPHPGVYITTAKMLDVAAEQCLAFEDSPNGILAAKSARMKCVAVPDESVAGSPKLAIADLVISKLSDFTEEMWEELDR